MIFIQHKTNVRLYIPAGSVLHTGYRLVLVKKKQRSVIYYCATPIICWCNSTLINRAK